MDVSFAWLNRLTIMCTVATASRDRGSIGVSYGTLLERVPDMSFSWLNSLTRVCIKIDPL